MDTDVDSKRCKFSCKNNLFLPCPLRPGSTLRGDASVCGTDDSSICNYSIYLLMTTSIID